MPGLEYCRVDFGFVRGEICYTYLHSDGEHIRDTKPLANWRSRRDQQLDFMGQTLAEMGQQGWQLCGVDKHTFYFSRPLP